MIVRHHRRCRRRYDDDSGGGKRISVPTLDHLLIPINNEVNLNSVPYIQKCFFLARGKFSESALQRPTG
jgi:hypothetical protein